MSLERESLQGLVNQAEKFSKAITKVGETSRGLGSDRGPAYLNYQEVWGLERVFRIKRIGEIRGEIVTRTIPLLENHRTEITTRMLSQVQEEVAIVRQYFQTHRITREERNLARQELSKLVEDLRITSVAPGRSAVRTEQLKRRNELDLQVQALREQQLRNQQISHLLNVPIWTVARTASRLIAKGEIERMQLGRPGPSRDYSEADATIKRLRAEGVSNEDIRKQVDLSVNQFNLRVHNLIQRGEIARLTGWVRAALEQALDRHLAQDPNKHVTLRELSEEIGVTGGRVRQLLEEMKPTRPMPPSYARSIEGSQEEFDKKVKELFDKGLNAREVSDELHVTVRLVNQSRSRSFRAETQAEREEREAQVRELREQGLGDNRIAEITGFKRPAVTHILKNLEKNDPNLRLRKVRRTKEEVGRFKDWVAELRLDPRNLTQRQIAEITGEKESTITNYTNDLIAEGRIPKRKTT